MIDGLQYFPEYITRDDETRLLAIVDKQLWLTSLKRRVQHYGYLYDYKRRTVDPSMFLGALPGWAEEVATKLYRNGYTTQIPDQVIVNEYLPGQGISSHVDCEPCFGEVIISLTLGSGCIMHFTQLKTHRRFPLYLEPCSLLVMQGAARYQWKHGILPRKHDEIDGKSIPRGRRVSLTFRSVVL